MLSRPLFVASGCLALLLSLDVARAQSCDSVAYNASIQDPSTTSPSATEAPVNVGRVQAAAFDSAIRQIYAVSTTTCTLLRLQFDLKVVSRLGGGKCLEPFSAENPTNATVLPSSQTALFSSAVTDATTLHLIGVTVFADAGTIRQWVHATGALSNLAGRWSPRAELPAIDGVGDKATFSPNLRFVAPAPYATRVIVLDLDWNCVRTVTLSTKQVVTWLGYCGATGPLPSATAKVIPKSEFRLTPGANLHGVELSSGRVLLLDGAGLWRVVDATVTRLKAVIEFPSISVFDFDHMVPAKALYDASNTLLILSTNRSLCSLWVARDSESGGVDSSGTNLVIQPLAAATELCRSLPTHPVSRTLLLDMDATDAVVVQGDQLVVSSCNGVLSYESLAGITTTSPGPTTAPKTDWTQGWLEIFLIVVLCTVLVAVICIVFYRKCIRAAIIRPADTAPDAVTSAPSDSQEMVRHAPDAASSPSLPAAAVGLAAGESHLSTTHISTSGPETSQSSSASSNAGEALATPAAAVPALATNTTSPEEPSSRSSDEAPRPLHDPSEAIATAPSSRVAASAVVIVRRRQDKKTAVVDGAAAMGEALARSRSQRQRMEAANARLALSNAETDAHATALVQSMSSYRSGDYSSPMSKSMQLAVRTDFDTSTDEINAQHQRRSALVLQGRFQRGRLLGRGANGTVYAVVLEDGTTAAMKAAHLHGAPDDMEKQARSLIQEMNLIMTLQHPHIVEVYGVFFDQQEMTVNTFMELVTGGSLGSLVRGLPEPLNEGVARGYIAQILRGLCYLHSRRIVHRDLKCDNMLLDSVTGSVRISDFGTARVIGASQSQLASTIVGTPFFMAPEVIEGIEGEPDASGAAGATDHRYGATADIWSLGILTAELLDRGRPPWPQFSHQSMLFMHIYSPNSAPIIPAHCSAEAAAFIRRCTIREPNRRPTAVELVYDPWVAAALAHTSPQAEDDF